MRVKRREVAHSGRRFPSVLIFCQIFLIFLHVYLMSVMIYGVYHVSWWLYFVCRTWRPINRVHALHTSFLWDRLLGQIPLANRFIWRKWCKLLCCHPFVAFLHHVRFQVIVDLSVGVVL